MIKSTDKLELTEIKEDEIGDRVSIVDFIKNIINYTIMDDDGYCKFIKDNEIITNAEYCIYDDTVILNNNKCDSLLSFVMLFEVKEILWYNK